MTQPNSADLSYRESNFSVTDPGPLEATGTTIPAEFADLVTEAEALAGGARAPATVRAYESDWRSFDSWCSAEGFVALPARPEVVCLYLASLAGHRKTATISRRLTSIAARHADAGLPSPVEHPVVQKVWQGIRRKQGTAKQGKAAAKVDELRAMVDTLDLGRTIGLRDRALLVIGFAGALRRSELVAIDVEHIPAEADGLRLWLPRSKTDQEGEGYELALNYGTNPATCPVRAVRDWRAAAQIDSGPLLRPVGRWSHVAGRRLTDRVVALVVKRCALAAGLDPTRYAGHSLRAGLITTVAVAGAQDREIMDHSRHRSVETMHGYVRTARLFEDSVVKLAGL